ncbi:response regulator [Paenibacillus piri]|uniref:Response regulator n=1 Tax=Paenibacillus piri TaxID=2547395 RepID=A0A4R5K8S1_9BACL|nr:response regulator [Paenibacillus piri]
MITAGNGQGSAEFLGRGQPAIGLVILDVMMPSQTGYETCRFLRRKFALI